MERVVIVSGVRTAVGNFGGTLKSVPAIELGATVIRELLLKNNIRPTLSSSLACGKASKLQDDGPIPLELEAGNWDSGAIPLPIDEVIMGNVIQTGQGQNPARQAINEAFAAQAIACMRDLNIDLELPNQVGSGISIGHPIGCTGARQLVTGMHQMQRQDNQNGLFSMCIGGGMGMAMIAERVG